MVGIVVKSDGVPTINPNCGFCFEKEAVNISKSTSEIVFISPLATLNGPFISTTYCSVFGVNVLMPNVDTYFALLLPSTII